MNRYKQTKKLSVTDAAYIAGLIDGEGTITLSKRHRNENRQLVVSISNNEKQLLDYLKDVTGVGTITKKRTYVEHHLTNYTYRISNRQAISLLEQTISYLHTHKQKRAEIVLDKYLSLTPRNGKYTDKLNNERKQFIEDFFKITP
ncbi:MAG: LAGLIDADG family homing endonuclease [Proteobacteria bacterium]|nr:LAGLIDADG family homing endonuclease [Pseudomonadota bacterium]